MKRKLIVFNVIFVFTLSVVCFIYPVKLLATGITYYVSFWKEMIQTAEQASRLHGKH